MSLAKVFIHCQFFCRTFSRRFKGEQYANLEELTIVISKFSRVTLKSSWRSCTQDDAECFEFFDELIHVVDKQSNIRKMCLSIDFQEAIRIHRHSIRENLIIKMIKLCM